MLKISGNLLQIALILKAGGVFAARCDSGAGGGAAGGPSGGPSGAELLSRTGPPDFSHGIYLLISLRKSTPTQNRHLDI